MNNEVKIVKCVKIDSQVQNIVTDQKNIVGA